MPKPILICLFLLRASLDIHAREVPAWPYERLFSKAGVIVLAGAISNKASADVFDDMGLYIGVNTVLQIEHVIKGKVEAPPKYLLFLKQRADGRYEPVTGQNDAALSIQAVTGPRHATTEDE